MATSEDYLDSLLRGATMKASEPALSKEAEAEINDAKENIEIDNKPVSEEKGASSSSSLYERFTKNQTSSHKNNFSNNEAALDALLRGEKLEEEQVEDAIIEETIIEENIIEEQFVEEQVIEEPVIEESFVQEPAIEEPVIEEAVIEKTVIEEQLEEDLLRTNAGDISNELPTIEENNEEPVLTNQVNDTAEVVDNTDNDDDIMNRRMTPEEIEALLASVDIDEDDVTDEDDIEEEVDPVQKILNENSEHVNTDKKPLIDMESLGDFSDISEAIVDYSNDDHDDSDSENMSRILSPEDIAKVIENADSIKAEEEATIEEVSEVQASETVSESEATPEESPELSDDPNKMMSPDDIAALIAGMGAEETSEDAGSEEEVEAVEEATDATPEESPELSDDPNKMMSPDDIAALIAGMGAEEETSEDAGSEEEVEAVEEATEATPEESPELSDDPNKMMSPDDIEALLAQMGNDDSDSDISTDEPASDNDGGETFEGIDMDASLAEILGEEVSAEESSLEESSLEESSLEGTSKDETVSLEENADSFDMDNLDEEDIEKMLKAASDVSGTDVSDINDEQDVNDLLAMLDNDEDENLNEISSLLKSDENAELVDPTLMDKMDKAEITGSDTVPEEKKKKEGFFSKLFSKFKKKSKNETTGDNADLESNNQENVTEQETSEIADIGEAESQDTTAFDSLFEAEATPDDGHIDEASLISDGETQTESTASKAVASDNSDKEASEEKKEKKPSLLQRIINALTEEVEEEVPVSGEGQAINISAENQAILDEIDAEGEEGKKKKAKKEKKPKKEKPKKPKKPKKEKLKEPEDPSKKIPRKYIIATAVAAASILAIILIITLYVPMLMTLGEARDAYYKKDYKNAFQSMYGKDLNDSDKLIYDRSKAIIILERKYEAYENYTLLNMKVEALNALFEGLERYMNMRDYGEELGVIEELNLTRDKILETLSNQYGISEADALDILTYEPLDYSLKLQSIINGEEFIRPSDIINSHYGFNSNQLITDILEEDDNIIPQYEDMLSEEEEYLNSINDQMQSEADGELMSDQEIQEFMDNHPVEEE